MMNIGEHLLSVLSRAESNVRIAAPFIKAHSLVRLLEAIPHHVKLTCVTRWRPEDIASGVCDIEIYDILLQRSGSVLMVQPHLHAKFFSADEKCLIGSANLTHTALGWCEPSNVELLVELNGQDYSLDKWWDSLLNSSIEATLGMKAALEEKADLLRSSNSPISRPETDPEGISTQSVWVPACPRWSGLWEVYLGDEEQMPASAIASAKVDLAVLCIPPGLDKAGFQKALRAALRKTKIIDEIEQLSQTGLTDAAAHALLQSQFSIPGKEVERRWQHIKSWLRDLYPEEYHIEANQEVLLRGRTL